MNKKDIRLLFAYNRWANARVLDAASVLTQEQLEADLATSHRSLHGTLTHILAAEWIWLMRCKGISPGSLLDPADFPSLDSLREKMTIVEEEQRELIDGLDDQELARVIAYVNMKGERWEYPLTQIMQHMVNHSSYHRGQAVGMLRQLGAEGVQTDYLAYIDTSPAGV